MTCFCCPSSLFPSRTFMRRVVTTASEEKRAKARSVRRTRRDDASSPRGRTVVIEEKNVDLNVIRLSKVSLVDELSIRVHELQIGDLRKRRRRVRFRFERRTRNEGGRARTHDRPIELRITRRRKRILELPHLDLVLSFGDGLIGESC